MDGLLSTSPSNVGLYGGLAFGVPLLVRFGISAVEAIRLREIHPKEFWKIFIGFEPEKEKSTSEEEKSTKVPADYWLPFILGVLEMLAYPVLIVSGQYVVVGFWLTFKTVHRWGYAPGYKRGPYNRYLVANASILIGSYLSAQCAF